MYDIESRTWNARVLRWIYESPEMLLRNILEARGSRSTIQLEELQNAIMPAKLTQLVAR